MMRDNSKKKLTLLFLISIIFIACFDIWVGASTSKAPVSHTPTTHSSGRQGQNYIVFDQRSFSSSIYVVAWSPDGTRIASASADGTMQIWDTFDRSHLFASPRHSWIVNSIAWSYDTHTQISLDNENRGIRIWNASRRSTTYTYPIRGDTLLEPATQEAPGILHQKSTSSGSRIIMITDGKPTERMIYQLRVASFIDHPGNITAAYASIEKALHIKQVEIFVDLVDRYNESLANEFSQRFLANAHRGRVWVHKELNDEHLKQLSALSDGTQEGFK